MAVYAIVHVLYYMELPEISNDNYYSLTDQLATDLDKFAVSFTVF